MREFEILWTLFKLCDAEAYFRTIMDRTTLRVVSLASFPS